MSRSWRAAANSMVWAFRQMGTSVERTESGHIAGSRLFGRAWRDMTRHHPIFDYSAQRAAGVRQCSHRRSPAPALAAVQRLRNASTPLSYTSTTTACSKGSRFDGGLRSLATRGRRRAVRIALTELCNRWSELAPLAAPRCRERHRITSRRVASGDERARRDNSARICIKRASIRKNGAQRCS